MRSLLLVAFLITASCAVNTSPPEITVVDLPTYRTYLVEMRSTLANADERSFEPGEKARLAQINGELLAALSGIETLDSLDAEQLANVMTMNDELHQTIVGENESRATGRVCTTEVPVGTNIRKTTCRSRSQIASDRHAARIMLDERNRDIERRDRMLEAERPETGFPHVPLGSG